MRMELDVGRLADITVSSGLEKADIGRLLALAGLQGEQPSVLLGDVEVGRWRRKRERTLAGAVAPRLERGVVPHAVGVASVSAARAGEAPPRLGFGPSEPACRDAQTSMEVLVEPVDGELRVGQALEQLDQLQEIGRAPLGRLALLLAVSLVHFHPESAVAERNRVSGRKVDHPDEGSGARSMAGWFSTVGFRASLRPTEIASPWT